VKRRALVTGGSGGIGAAICKRLAREGHHLYVHANRGIQAASQIVADITAAGGKAQTLSFDVTDAEATRVALESVLNDGPIQILINNAGIHADAVFPGMSSDQWHRVIDTSVDG
jgi:3-oxoacyl-[acyl-carrier protein] reductase